MLSWGPTFGRAAEPPNCWLPKIRNPKSEIRNNFESLEIANTGKPEPGNFLAASEQAGRLQRREPEWITHVGIYLGDKLFIQSSQRVRINSLDPGSSLYDERHAHSLLLARRVLPGEGGGAVER